MPLRIWKIDASFEVNFISSDQLQQICSMGSHTLSARTQKENKASQGLSKSKARAFKTLNEVKGKIFTKGNKVFQETEQEFSANLGGVSKWNFFQQKEHKFSAKCTKIVS